MASGQQRAAGERPRGLAPRGDAAETRRARRAAGGSAGAGPAGGRGEAKGESRRGGGGGGGGRGRGRGRGRAGPRRPHRLLAAGAGAGAGGRASCGHWVSAAELEPWVRALLQQGTTSWSCPRCPDARWLWQELRDLGLFSGEDQAWLEATILAQEGARSSYRQCPRCQLLVQRPAPGPLRTACPPCSRKAGQLRYFCWGCHGAWEEPSALGDTSHGSLCALLTVLHDAPAIQAPESTVHGCPSLRACPQCRALVTHNGRGCPMVRCPQCQAWFCYRCLDAPGHWHVCMVAARQQDFSRRAAAPPPRDRPVLPAWSMRRILHVARQ